MITDVNVDLGELGGTAGRQRELVLLPYATRINVACGFHAGDEDAMRVLCSTAAECGVLVGAHIGYRDREHFGRRELSTDVPTLAAEAAAQLATLTAIANEFGVVLSHVKPHGALYHRLTTDHEAAGAVIEAITSTGAGLGVLTLPGSALAAAAAGANVPVLREGFADRAYEKSGGLVPRGVQGALLAPREAAVQARTLAEAGTVDTICIHGDDPSALDTLRAVREALSR